MTSIHHTHRESRKKRKRDVLQQHENKRAREQGEMLRYLFVGENEKGHSLQLVAAGQTTDLLLSQFEALGVSGVHHKYNCVGTLVIKL